METLARWGESQGYVRYIHEKTGVKKEYIVIVLLVLAIMLVAQGIMGGFVIFFIGVVIPTYQSFKAIESPEKTDDTRILKYWCVFSIFIVVDKILEPFLSFIPLIGFMTFIIIVLLVANEYKGSQYVYQYMVAPWVGKYQNSIDKVYGMTKLGQETPTKS